MFPVDDELLRRVLAGIAEPEEVRRVQDAVDASPRIRARLAALAEEQVTAARRGRAGATAGTLGRGKGRLPGNEIG